MGQEPVEFLRPEYPALFLEVLLCFFRLICIFFVDPLSDTVKAKPGMFSSSLLGLQLTISQALRL